MNGEQQTIKPIVSGGGTGRIYGIVDPKELKIRQQQQRIQQQQQMAKLYSIPTRTGGTTSQLQQPVSMLSLMYPVSSGSEHRRVFENTDRPSQPPQMYAPNAPIQELINRRQDLLQQSQQSPNNYLVQLALEDCETQISQWAAYNQQQQQHFNQPETNRASGINERPEGMSRKQFNKMQPWVRKDSLRNGLRVSGGVGKKLLKGMGWKEGFGIGRVSGGPVEPIVPDNVRASDRRGLSTDGEASTSSTTGVAATGKHPISVLMELCQKNHFAPPEFIEVLADGPSHRPHFIMKVRVNEVDYQPTNASSTKKDAKAMAAIVCLRALGVLSSTPATSNMASLFEISTKTTATTSPTPTAEVEEQPPTQEITANSDKPPS